MLTLDKLTYAYDKTGQTYRFDLTVAPGEIVAISGQSGAGKSTLLDLVAGFLPASGGTIAFDQTDLTRVPPEQRPVAILFQADNLFDHLSVAANLRLGLPKGLPRAEADHKIAEALAAMRLEGLGPRRATNLSGGQKQRVALARTLLRNRPILLLDEPFSALDRDTADTLRTQLRALVTQNGWHTLLVSHQSDDLAGLPDRHFVLADGILSQAN